MDSHNILSLLGLALRGGRLAVGEEPVEAVARAKDARVLLLAGDASDHTRRRVIHFAQAGACLWLPLPFSKAELGQALGRTAVAVLAVTDVGLAHAVVRRLADLDEAKYGEAAERLALKAKRAAERQAERKAHQRNVRTGVHRAKAPPPKPQKAAAVPETPTPGKWRSRPPAGAKPSVPGKGRTRSARSGPRTNPYAHSRPVKKGKGSFRRREG